jgi:hypothetical protein
VGSSSRQARGILAIWNDCAAGAEKAYEAWYRGEHLPERLSVPGFRAAWRFRAVDAAPEYFTFYETADPDVLFSEAYVGRVNNPTPLTRQIMSGTFLNTTRALCASVARTGAIRGALAVVVRYESGTADALEAGFPGMAARPRCCARSCGSRREARRRARPRNRS